MKAGTSWRVGVWLLCVAGCAVEAHPLEPSDEEVGVHAAEVVYGEDDRRDVYEVRPGTFRDRAMHSSIALMSYGFLRSTPEGIMVGGQPLGQVEGLCADERFYDQPVAASCSGTLVAEDLILTAGHCAASLDSCSNMAVVFNYRMLDSSRLRPLSDDDIYSCVEIVARSLPDSNSLDFAFLRLDRPVAPHLHPAPIRVPLGLLPRGAIVTMIGHPSGLPAKITGNGVTRDESIRSGNLFLTNLDAFAGNSGSGVYDEDGALVGVLVWGELDYRDRDGESCREVNRLPENGAGEGVVYAFRALESLCVQSPFVSSVCETYCADSSCVGVSTLDEFCGREGCEPPPSWYCEPEAFASGGPCDCECGAFDPDCTLPSRPVIGCQDGMVCGDEGQCELAPDKSRGGLFGGCEATGGAESGLALALVLAALARTRRARRRELKPEM
jgi:hypothetical protein